MRKVKKKKKASELFPARTRALVLSGVLRCAQYFPYIQRFLHRGLPWHCLPRKHSELVMGSLWGHERHIVGFVKLKQLDNLNHLLFFKKLYCC